MKVKMSMDRCMCSTPLPNFFIDYYMAKANPIFSLIYIYIYKKCLYGCDDLDIEHIAKTFGIIESDVINALKYWQSKKLIMYSKTDISLSVKFVMPSHIEDDEKQKKIYKFPSYTMEELNLYKNDENIKRLFGFAENCLGRYLTYSDLNTLFGIYDYLRLPLDVIEILLAYCVQNGHKNLSYIEKVAIDWSDSKIDSSQKAEDKIDGMNGLYRQVKKALAVDSLNFEQRKLISYWNKELNISEDLIVEACNITMMSIGKPSFKYLKKVIENFCDGNVMNLQQLQQKESNYKRGENKITSKNKFANFEQHDWDWDKIEKILQEE